MPCATHTFLRCIYVQDVILKKRILKSNEVSDWVSYITVSETLCVRSHNKDAIRILQQQKNMKKKKFFLIDGPLQTWRI